MADSSDRLSLPHFLVIIALLIACIGLECYFHFILGIHIVYTHLFYIPIVLAALWWGLKGGLFVSLFLGLLHIVFHLPKIEISVLDRSFVLIVMGFVIGIISEKRIRAEKELRREKEVEAVFRYSGGGIRSIGTDYKIINQNEEMDALCGVKKAEAVGRKCSEVFPGPRCNTDKCILRQILSGAERIEIETERTTKKGKTIPVSLVATALKDEEGKVVGVIESFLDITERKEMERALRESEERLRVILETSQVGTVIIDAETHEIIDINPRALEVLGVLKEQVVGHICHKHICPAEKGKCPITDLGQAIDRSERVLLKVSGEEVPILKSVVPIILGGRKCLIESFMDIAERKEMEKELREHHERLEELVEERTVELTAVNEKLQRDITERKKAVELLKESEEKYRNLIERANDGVAIIQDALLKYVSPRLSEIIGGYTVKETINTPVVNYIHSDERSKIIDRYEQRMAGKDVSPIYETVIVHKDGSKINVELNAGLIMYQGKPADLVFVRDITERKKTEKHIERLNRVLRAISDINELVVKESDPEELLKKSCKVLVQSRDYSAAQATLTKDDKPVFQTVAVEPELESKDFTFEKYNYGSCKALSLSHKDKIFGTFIVCSKLPHAFDAEEVKLLEEVCEDIGFALESMEKEERRKRAEVKLENKVSELTSLSEVSVNISSTLEIDKVLNLSLGSARQLLDVECGSIMLLDEGKKFLTVAASSGLSKEFAEVKEKPGEGIAGYVAKTGRPLFLKKDMKDTPFEKYKKERKIKDALSIPIMAKDKVIGVFNVDNKRQGTFTQSDLRLFTILASEVGAAIENARLYQDIKQGLLNTVKALAMAVDAKDPYTHGHSERVVKYSLAIAKEMNLPKEEMEEIEISARLHDVGKIGVSGKILGKQTGLTEKEWNVIKKHPTTSVKILEPVDFSPEIVSCVLSHHERLDGKGYPNGISKDKIPLGASIIKVADAYDAMTSDRPYREALSFEKAICELKKHSGTQFHPEVVEAFLRETRNK